MILQVSSEECALIVEALWHLHYTALEPEARRPGTIVAAKTLVNKINDMS